MTKALDGQVAVVTGATHGLGHAIATHLAELGANIVLVARGQEALDATRADVEAHGVKALAVSCDIADRTAVQAAADTITGEMGRVDILVNNAGIPAPRTFAETSFDDWDHVIGVNLSGAFYMTRALWEPLTANSGYVVNISGTAALRGGGSPAYGGSKFGLTGLNHSIAAAGKEHGLRATILYPGGMDTGWRGAEIGKPREESMDPAQVAAFVGRMVTAPPEFVVNEAVMNPINYPFM
jgi:NAD(P)-dependent dehydrogenase (short-subunit alcohol dehydrogenase family)